MTKRVFSILFASAVTLSSVAQVAGTSGFEFLNLPYSSHASALGGDNISVIEDDASLAMQNPALMQSVSHNSVSLGYMNYMEGVPAFSANYVYAYDEKMTLGGLAQYVNYGKMKQADVNNNVTGDFSASDLALGAQLSYNLTKDLVGGVTAKFIYSHIGDYSSTAVAVDLGLNYYDAEKDFSASAVVKNLGGQLSAYYEDYESLPLNVLLGVTKRVIGTPLRVSLTASDLNHMNYSLMRHFTFGADLILSQQMYIAAGYNFRRGSEMKVATHDEWGDEDTKSGGAGLSIGLGLQLEKFKIHASYGKYHVSSSSLLFNASFTL